MNRNNIIEKLKFNHKGFMKYIDSLDDQEFHLSKNGSWTAGQQLDHIHRSVRPLVLALSLPGLVTGLAFGKANRPSRTFDELVSKYQGKLTEGGKATGPYVPQPIPWEKKEKLIHRLSRVLEKLVSKLNNYQEEKLDELILPHPLLGKLTIREMMYFTIYHVKHHHKITIKNLEAVE